MHSFVLILLLFALSCLLAGSILFLLSSYKIARRFFVIKIRMPIRKWLKYRPAKLKPDHYIVEDE